MRDVTYITGNIDKAKYLAKYIGIEIKHKDIQQQEIQSLDLIEVVKHKAVIAYKHLRSPILVEDVSLEFKAFGRLPGTFIKFYIDELPLEKICRSLDSFNREAIAKCVFAYYDGMDFTFFKGKLDGQIADHPSGDNGYGWDKIFIANGYDITRASLNNKQYKSTYFKIKPLAEIKNFLINE